MTRRVLSQTVCALAAGLIAAAAPAAAQDATTVLKSPDGARVGEVTLAQTPHGVLITVRIENAPPGVHAFHIHEHGVCTPPDFSSAGGHFNPAGKEHGIRNARGRHAGDLPNLHVGENGKLVVEILADQVSLGPLAAGADLLDSNGSALVMHAGADDYTSDPAGAAGKRIACGEIGTSG